MNETAPKYIIELKNELKKDIKTLEVSLISRMDKMDVKIGQMDVKMNQTDRKINQINEKLDEVIERQNTHFEAIGELKVQVTGIELSLKDKASHDYVREIEKRTDRLEKVVFA